MEFKEGKLTGLILTAEESIALNKKYGLTIQPTLMRQDFPTDYEPLLPVPSTIRADNIFKVGDVVAGESLIGYEKFYQKLREKILDERKSIFCVGLPKTGKTSLIKKLHKEAASNDKLIEIFIGNLQEFASKENPFAAFLFSIAEKVKKELSERDCNKKTVGKFYANFDELQKLYHDDQKRFLNSFKRLFQEIKILNMHVLLSVDDFDSAEIIFKDSKCNTVFDALAEPKYAINTVLILNYREKESEKNSITLRGLHISDFLPLLSEKFSLTCDIRINFETINIKVFSDDDINVTFNILKTAYNIDLSAIQIEQIRYYAGCFPYMYSAFCYNIVKEKLQSGKNSFDIEEIYKDNIEPIISDYTENLCKVLKLGGNLDEIRDILFDSKNNDDEWHDIDRFLRIGYLKEFHLNGDRYQALSGHFTDYLRKQYLSQYSSEDVAKNILNLHKLLKTIILKSFRELKEEEWKKIMERKFNLGRYNSFVDKNQRNFEDCNKKVALFNALSLKDIFSLIQVYWQPISKKYFDGQELSFFKKGFELCAKVRDIVCHANENFIKKDKAREIMEVNSFCVETLKLIGENWQMNSIKFDPLTKK